MQMEAKVDNVRLRFPLDLSLGGILAVQQGDTVVAAKELAVGVQLLPLFDGNVEVDDIHLYEAKLNTRNLIEACHVKGTVGSLALVSHHTSLTDEHALINHARLNDADICVVLNDSVPEDTTESQPVNWCLDLPDIKVSNVTANLFFSGQHATAHIGEGKASAFLDLGSGTYDIRSVKLKKSSGGYENFSISINNLESQLCVDTTKLAISKFKAETTDSRFDVKGRMDFSAFDSINPGTFDLRASAQIGWDDIRSVLYGFLPEADAKDLSNTLGQYLPKRPIQTDILCNGNLQHLKVDKFNALIERFATLNSNATMDDWRIKADAKLNAWNATVTAKADYDINNEAYELKTDIRNLVVNNIVRLSERCSVSASAHIKGQGFDYLSPAMRLEADVQLPHAHYGKMNLSTSKLGASLKHGNMTVDFGCHNEQLMTDLALKADVGSALATASGKKVRESISAKLLLNLPKMDLEAMGLLDTAMVVSTAAKLSLSAANWSGKHPLLNLDARVRELEIHTAYDSVMTNRINLSAFTTTDSTALRASSGDLLVDFQAPNNLADLLTKIDHFTTETQKQIDKRSVDFYTLRKHMPTLHLHAEAGLSNPLIPILSAYDIIFEDLLVDVETSSEKGLLGDARLYYMRYDSLAIDTTYFHLTQDSARLAYNTAIVCQGDKDQLGFSAYLDGSLTMRDLDSHIRFYGPKGKQGIDLGVHGVITDTALNVKFYPEKPIIAFHQFDMNTDNYIQVPVVNQYIDPVNAPVLADIRLRSLADSCLITLSASPTEDDKQYAKATIQNLNIENWLRILPFLPDLKGIFSLEAFYDNTNNTEAMGAEITANKFTFDDIYFGKIHGIFNYTPEEELVHSVTGSIDFNDESVADIYGIYQSVGDGSLDADVYLHKLPLTIADPFIPDQIARLTGYLAGELNIKGETDALQFNGNVFTNDVHIISDPYSADISIANDTISITGNRVLLDHMKLYAAGDNPLTINGYYDFADFDNMGMAISLYGKEIKLIEAKRSRKSLLFGNVYGDIMCRVNGTMQDLTIRGLVNVLSNTNVTYILNDASISQGDRLDDIVTFVDFTMPPDTTDIPPTPMGIDMNVTLNIEDGAKFNCEFSADRQSYVNLRAGGSVNMLYTPEGVFNLVGRVVVNEGEMKYTLPVIPLKTFQIVSGSSVEFNGDPANPRLNISALVKTRASVSSSGSTARSVAFNVGLKISNTLDDMGLLFTLEAPSDGEIQNDLLSYTDEEKNKLAVALLATGMYIADNNSSVVSASSALNTFLQAEINNITGKALGNIVDVSMGIDQTTYANGSTGTDYSFKFSKRFFSDRLSIVIGGRVSDNKVANASTGVGSFINDVSLEWRLDNSATRYVRLFHCKDYENVVDGELEKNGAGLVLRRKVDKITELFMFKKKELQVNISTKKKTKDSDKNKVTISADTDAATKRKEEKK